MASLATEVEEVRYRELLAAAPIRPRSRAIRDGDRFLLCGTIGSEFDVWQRRLAALSAADAYFSQRIGLDAVEKVMDELEASLKVQLSPGESLKPRCSPGYPGIPLSDNYEILDKLDAAKLLGVTVTASGLLAPSKSVTAICEIERAESEA